MNTPKSRDNWRVETKTPASIVAGIVMLVIIVLLAFGPFFASRGAIADLFFMMTMLVLAQCWNLLAGYAGLVSVGQQAFVGIGAYTLFFLVNLAGFDPLISMGIAGVASLILAIPIALFAFRLEGAYFAVGTWVMAEIVRLLISQVGALGGNTGVGLPRGLMSHLPAVEWIKDVFSVRASAATDIFAYWIALVLMVATIMLSYWLLRSKYGIGLAGMRDNVAAARSVGVNATKMKLMVFMSTAFVTGICGALIYLQKGRISPSAAFSLSDWTASVIFIVIIGGVGTIEGPIIGVIVFFVLRNFLADIGTWYMLILGVIAIATMMFAPRGLWGIFVDKTGIQLFPIQRRLLHKTDK